MKKQETIYLKNMFGQSCVKLIDLFFRNKVDVEILHVELGAVTLLYDEITHSRATIISWFDELGFGFISDPDVEIAEKTKIAAIELIYEALNSNSLVRNSDYISERLQLPYDKISRVFSHVTGINLAKYIILLKMEKAKDLLLGNEYTVSEISYMMEYSSVQYFSNQFKKYVGVTISKFKENPKIYRKQLENLI